jgi:hypothetical protein
MPTNLELREEGTGDADNEWMDVIDIVRVGGKYRLGKKIGSGSFGVLNSLCSLPGFLLR